ncbi:hypothetical protein IID19_03800 [Patescibacteria group bacterium]|nr:hypothetical protein [Patescibacteria group bacterium]
MVEQQTSKCQNCGYPIDSGEHASDCPKVSGDLEMSVEKDESFKDESNFDISELSDLVKEELTSESKKEFWQKGRERITGVMRRLVLWGMITSTALAAFESKAFLKSDDSSESDQTTEEFASIKRVPKQGKTEFVPVTNPEAAIRIQEKYKQQREEHARKTDAFANEMKEVYDSNQGELDYLAEAFGRESVHDFFDKIQETEWYKEFPERGTIGPDTTVATGFENVEMDPDSFMKLCRETYPNNWVTTEIDSIIYKVEDESADSLRSDKYNLGEGWTEVGKARMKEGDIASVNLSGRRNIADVLETFGHELGHVNDWEYDNTLSPADKIKLFHAITKRFLEGENLFPSDYVESIDNPDPQRNMEIKVQEYWAEICAQYFSDPSNFQDNYPEDFALVDDWVKKQDPVFDPIESRAQRYELAESFSESYREEIYQNRMGELSEGLRSDLETWVEEKAYNTAKSLILEGSGSISRHEIERAVQNLFAEHGQEMGEDINWLVNRFMMETSNKASDYRETHRDEIIADVDDSMSDEAKREFEILRSDVLQEAEEVIKRSLDWATFQTIISRKIEDFMKNNNIQSGSEYLLLKIFSEKT